MLEITGNDQVAHQSFGVGEQYVAWLQRITDLMPLLVGNCQCPGCWILDSANPGYECVLAMLKLSGNGAT